MTSFDPATALQQFRAERQRDKEAAEQACRQKQAWWAAYDRRSALLNQLNNLFRSETAVGTAEVGKATALMVEYAQTLPVESVKACVAFVNHRLAELSADGKFVLHVRLKEILLNLLLLAREGENAKVAEIFNEALRGDSDDVETFRLCLVNWLMDKVVEGLPPLPDELKQPVEAPAESQDVQAPLDERAAPTGAGSGDTDGAGPRKERLHFDPQTQTITLDGMPYKIEDPKAFSLYKEIASCCPNPLTKAILQERVRGCRGDKKIRQLLNGLPKRLCDTVLSGSNGYWLDLNPPSNRHQ